ncbi:C6 transcription factor protein [Rutstroemia sp. NJR-2017a BVV2]|nr:C6 transcription factor protein [Rutstroemia sp. NJR-2017a BVV2]
MPSPTQETTPLLSPSPSSSSSTLSPLYKFNLAIGLPLPLPSHPPTLSYTALRAGARGLYSTILTLHRHYTLHYHVLSTIYYSSLIAQLCIGAVLALAQPSKSGVTALGAANSVLVGVLGILKSQGLVEKAAGNEGEMRKVRDWVEEWEGRLVIGGEEEDVDVQALVEEAWDRYGSAVEVVERNRLGRFGAAGKRGGGLGLAGGEEEGKKGSGSGIVRRRSDEGVAEDRRLRRG